MAKLSKDLSVGTLHPRETLFATGTLGGLNAELVAAADGAATVLLDLRGTFNLAVTIEATVDGTNWMPIAMRPLNATAVQYVATVNGSAAGIWAGSLAGFRGVRARCSAYTSGAAAASMTVSTSPLDASLTGTVTPLLMTSTGASGAAVTLSLPSPGAGLRHYLTYLSINRYAAAVLTASATPIVVTTTNLPGSLTFTFEADAAALGTMVRWREDFAYPLVGTLPNVATTIAMPATTGVIWRATAGYYVGP